MALRCARVVIVGALFSLGITARSDASDTPAPPDEATRRGAALHGFATLGAARGTDERSGVVHSFSQKRPTFDRWSVDLDTVVGGQLEWRSGGAHTLIVQGVARAGTDFEPDLALAFWRFQLAPQVALRLGRIASPLFYDTDIINVGYANTMVRSPLATYTKINAIDHLDGADLSFMTPVRRWLIGAQLFAGQATYDHYTWDNASVLRARADDIRGIALTAVSNDLKIRLSHTASERFSMRSRDIERLNEALVALAGNVRMLSSAHERQAEYIESLQNPLDSRAVYTSLSAAWSPHRWHLLAEWTRLSSDRPWVGNTDAWQLVMARATGEVTPYGFVSRQTTRRSSSMSINVPAALAPYAATIQATIERDIERTDLSMRTLGVGVRWDFAKNWALKLQAERLVQDVPLALADPATQSRSRSNSALFSIALDWMH